jgi:hypothetical protein
MTMPTLLQIAQRNGSDGLAGLIDEASKAHPEILIVPVRTIKGTQYKTLIRTSVPTGGSFRGANEGVVAGKSGYENRLVECFIFDKRWECDKAVADASEDGRAAFIADEAGGVMEGAMQDLAAQFYYGKGTGGQAGGFPGLINQYDAAAMVVDAGGTTASTGSSVWFMRLGNKDVTMVLGQGGSLQMSDVRVESIAPDADEPTKKTDGYVQTLTAWTGCQVGSKTSVVRIKKLTEDAGKGLTDDLISDALAKFPAGKGPTVCFMTQRSLRQLQKSRTATTPTGADAPWPTELVGVDGQKITIKVTDAILNSEALDL